MNYALEVKDVVKVYPDGLKALKGINLKVQQGDFFALLGPNGAGKSTLIGIISSLVKKTSGSVKIFEHDLDSALDYAKLSLGLVPQEFNFNQFETLDQILINQAGFYGVDRKVASKRSENLLKKLQLWDKKDVQARALSGGMKRRLMVARALMHEPKLLILDEPTAGVDVELRRFMWDFLIELNNGGTTIILTTHYLEEAELLCRNIGIIDQGELIHLANMKSLLLQLNMETFILDVKHLDTPPIIDGVKLRFIDNTTLEIDVAKTDSLNTIFKLLSEKGINVLSMRNQANRLEKLFLDIVDAEKD